MPNYSTGTSADEDLSSPATRSEEPPESVGPVLQALRWLARDKSGGVPNLPVAGRIAAPGQSGLPMPSTVPLPATGQSGLPIQQGPPPGTVSGISAPATPVAAPAPAITAATTAGPSAPAGAPQAPAQEDPGTAALATLLSPRLGGATRPLGMSPADKAEDKRQQEGIAREQQQAEENLQADRAAAAAFSQHTAAMATESQVAKVAQQEDLRRSTERRASIDAESKKRQGKIEAQLAALDAQGVNANQYFQKMSTGQQIGAALAIGLGTFGAHPLGPRGGPSENVALGIINHAMDQEFEAQKINLQKSITLAGRRADLEEQGFNRDLAMLNAERDSIQSNYTATINDLSRRAGLYQGNAEYQQNLQRLIQGTQAARDQRVDEKNKEIYALHKRAETPVGGGANTVGDKIRAFAKQIYVDSKGAVPWDQALRQAGRAELGVDVNPGSPEPGEWGAGGSGRISARLVGRVADLNAADNAIKELNDLNKRDLGALSFDDRGRARVAAKALIDAGYPIASDPLTLGPNGLRAALASVKKDIRIKRDTITSMGRGTGDSPEELGLEDR